MRKQVALMLFIIYLLIYQFIVWSILIKFSAEENFSYSATQSQGRNWEFISLSGLNQAENGYIKDEAIIMEVEIFKISII
jgi:hypothetical protein